MRHPFHSQSLALEKRNQPILRYIQIKVRDRFHGRYLFMLRKMHQCINGGNKISVIPK